MRVSFGFKIQDFGVRVCPLARKDRKGMPPNHNKQAGIPNPKP